MSYGCSHSSQEGAESFVGEFQGSMLLDFLGKDWFLEPELVYI